MRVNWNLNHVEITDGLKEHMEGRVAKLGKRLQSWADDAVVMTISMEKVGSREEYKCILNLALPQKTLHAEETRTEKKTAFNDCYNDLMRQEKKMMARLRREDRFHDVANAKRTLEQTLGEGSDEEE